MEDNVMMHNSEFYGDPNIYRLLGDYCMFDTEAYRMWEESVIESERYSDQPLDLCLDWDGVVWDNWGESHLDMEG
jgi:hypothetical protein